mmetsp:Transcript_5683/g.15928  ORF Transcript_5683/g.15928 Transcript_5683/m.15928 type:complete len:250 (+) Transcript_5683:1962-2711(+)
MSRSMDALLVMVGVGDGVGTRSRRYAGSVICGIQPLPLRERGDPSCASSLPASDLSPTSEPVPWSESMLSGPVSDGRLAASSSLKPSPPPPSSRSKAGGARNLRGNGKCSLSLPPPSLGDACPWISGEPCTVTVLVVDDAPASHSFSSMAPMAGSPRGCERRPLRFALPGALCGPKSGVLGPMLHGRRILSSACSSMPMLSRNCSTGMPLSGQSSETPISVMSSEARSRTSRNMPPRFLGSSRWPSVVQ